MHPIPLHTDWSFLVGKTVTQVCLGRYDAQIHLSEYVSIYLFDPGDHVRLHRSEKLGENLIRDLVAFEGNDRILRLNQSLVCLVGEQVRSAHTIGDHCLSIEFESHDTLELSSKCEEYECFQVTSGDWSIIL